MLGNFCTLNYQKLYFSREETRIFEENCSYKDSQAYYVRCGQQLKQLSQEMKNDTSEEIQGKLSEKIGELFIELQVSLNKTITQVKEEDSADLSAVIEEQKRGIRD